jgi:predicted nucleic acid-binding protein
LTPETFLDTNVLIYAATGRLEAPRKHAIAQGLLTTRFGTSAQVLAEFYTAAIRKGAEPLTPEQADEWLRLLARKPCEDITPDLVLGGIRLSRRYRISYWDAAIIAAAERLGAGTIYSEDLSHGQTYGSVAVVNPFLEVV